MKPEAERGKDTDLRGPLLRQCVAMANFALSSGTAIPSSVAETIESAAGAVKNAAEGAGTHAQPAAASDGFDIRKLVAAHGSLSRIVAPATPQAILLFASDAGSRRTLHFLGPVPLVRRMMLAALASLALFIGMALFRDVTGDISFADEDSEKLLHNLLFLLAAAGLGASFSALFQVNRYITEANYDPKFEASYWIRFTLGLIAGIILAQLVPIGEEGSAGAEGIGRLAKPTLALLGGFSAAVVYRILNRLVAAVDTLVRGETREIVAAQENAAKARLAEQAAETRIATISSLVVLQQQLDDGTARDKIKGKIAELLEELRAPGLSAADSSATHSSAGAPGGQAPDAAKPDTPAAPTREAKSGEKLRAVVQPVPTPPAGGEKPDVSGG